MAGLMNDDCDRLCNVKSWINEREHQSYFFRSVEGIPLSTATVRPLSTDHRLLQTLGRQKGAAGLALPEQKAGLAMGVEHRARNQCTSQIPGWQAAPGWAQLVADDDWFLQSKYKEQVSPLFLGPFWKDS